MLLQVGASVVMGGSGLRERALLKLVDDMASTGALCGDLLLVMAESSIQVMLLDVVDSLVFKL